jgi:hypothetical protein
MDKFDALIGESQLCVVLLTNLDYTDFEFVRVKPPMNDAAQRELLAGLAGRALYFTGNIGLVNGEPRTALEQPIDSHILDALARAFVAWCGIWLRASAEQQTVGDEVEWLRRLWALTPRPDA